MLGFAALAEVALAEIPGTSNNITPARKVVGWGFRHRREDLERRLKEQRGSTFNRRWFDELLEAEHALVVKAEKAKSEPQREALEEAANAAAEIIEREEPNPLPSFDPTEIITAFQNAVQATRVQASIRRANQATAIAAIIAKARAEAELNAQLEDDDEAILLLLNG